MVRVLTCGGLTGLARKVGGGQSRADVGKPTRQAKHDIGLGNRFGNGVRDTQLRQKLLATRVQLIPSWSTYESLLFGLDRIAVVVASSDGPRKVRRRVPYFFFDVFCGVSECLGARTAGDRACCTAHKELCGPRRREAREDVARLLEAQRGWRRSGQPAA